MRLPRLYAIVDAGVLSARGVELREYAEGLRAAGVRLVQYRDKAGSPQEVLRGAGVVRKVFAEGEYSHVSDEEAVAIMGHPDALLIMNDRVDLAVLAGFGGVHVGQGDLLPEDARVVLASRWPTQMFEEAGGVGGVVGVSTHTEAQVRAADLSCADYVAIGPVFATGTKADAAPVVGLAGVRRARALTAKPLVAIGGITRANARSVVDAGADCVAVISALVGRPGETERLARELLEELG